MSRQDVQVISNSALFNTQKKFRLELLFYFLCLFVTASFVYHRGQDAGGDLFNYHFYQGYSLVNGRFMEDMAAAGAHSFFNPITDVLAYLSIAHLPFPLSAWSLLLVQLTSIPAIVLLAKEIASDLGYPRAFMPAFPAILLSLLAPIWWAELGMSLNDATTAPLIIYGVYFLFSAYKGADLSMTRIAIAGMLFCLSVGLKMTNGPFFVSGFLMFAALLYRSGLRVSVLAGFYFLAGCGVGFLLTAWWNWYLWLEWGSPVFPFYNSIFKSEFHDFSNWNNTLYHFSSFQEFLTFIVQSAWDTNRTTAAHWRTNSTGHLFADARLLSVTMLVPAAILCKPAMRLNRRLMAFILFMASSFLLWVFLFSIQRYLIPFELLLGLLLWVLVVHIVERDWLRKSLMICVILCAGLLIKVPDFSHVPIALGEKNPFSITDEEIYSSPARYIVTGDTISYLLPSLHPDSKFYGIYAGIIPMEKSHDRIFRKLAEPSELPLRILFHRRFMSNVGLTLIGLERQGLLRDVHSLDCRTFRIRKLEWGNYNVCELQSNSENKLGEDLSAMFNDAVEVDLSSLSDASHCDGHIDFVNGISPASQSSVRTNLLLAARGWLVASVKAADVPDRVYLVLSNADGKRYLFNAEPTHRPDVGSHFKNPALNYSGFSAIVNVSKLFGQYHLGLAYEKDNKILVCPQFSIPIAINQD